MQIIYTTIALASIGMAAAAVFGVRMHLLTAQSTLRMPISALYAQRVSD